MVIMFDLGFLMLVKRLRLKTLQSIRKRGNVEARGLNFSRRFIFGNGGLRRLKGFWRRKLHLILESTRHRNTVAKCKLGGFALENSLVRNLVRRLYIVRFESRSRFCLFYIM